MVERIKCPPESVLKELLDGKVDEPQLSVLSQHVEDCGTCQEKARTLSPSDTLVQSLRTDPESAKKIADSAPLPLVEKVKEIARRKSSAGTDTLAGSSEDPSIPGNSTDADLDFLAPPQNSDEIGRLGTYRILKVLGKGGMGVVFLANDPELDRLVALKVMLPTIAANPSAKQRFLREARIAAKLRSDHIVTIYQVSEDRGIPFLAMELLEGMPLDGVLQSGRQLSLPQILCIGKDVAKGLAAAHENGLIHRDIKPANLWLDQVHDSRVKILDFGLARAEQDDIHLTQSGAIVGTPAYMAPEQARSEKAVDARVDLFSLGCVLYRLCVGDIPFKGDTTMGVLLAIAMNDPVPPVRIDGQIPPALSELIMQLLEKDAAKRPVSARDVIARLQEIEKSVAELRSDLQKADLGTVPSDATNIDVNLANLPAPPLPGMMTALEQAKAEAKAAAAPNSALRKRRPVVFAIVALLFVSVIALGGAVYYWQTNSGVVRIEINDPDIQVVFDTKGPTFKGIDKHEIKVTPGEHGMHVKRGDLEFVTDRFILKKGETITLRIEWHKGGTLKVLQGEKVLGEKNQKKINVAVNPLVTVDCALRFDGGSKVNVPKLPLATDRPFTLEAWVTPDSGDLKKQASIITAFNLAQLRTNSSGGAWWFDLQGRAVSTVTSKAGLGGKRPLHLTGVSTGNEVLLFVDGKLVGRKTVNIEGATDAKNTVIGESWLGLIGEVRISKVARYDEDFTPKKRFEPDVDTLALFHFDDGKGDVLTDASGHGHHGKIVGAHWARSDGTPIVPSVP